MLMVLEILFGFVALFGQGYALPADFTRGAVEWSVPVSDDGFVGLVWVCDPSEAGDYSLDILGEQSRAELRAVAVDPTNDYAEVCYSGVLDGALVTGP